MSNLPRPSSNPSVITIYGVKDCAYTQRARKLVPNAVFHNITDYMTRQEFQFQMRPVIGNYLTVPVVFVGNEFIGGYNELAKRY